MKTIKDSFIKFMKQQYFTEKLVDYNYQVETNNVTV